MDYKLIPGPAAIAEYRKLKSEYLESIKRASNDGDFEDERIALKRKARLNELEDKYHDIFNLSN